MPQNASTHGPVLILDDEAIIAFDLADTVELSGRRVLGPALSIEQAMALVETERPHCAILDIDVSGQTVWRLARHLRALGCAIVFISANCRHSELALEFAGCRALEKPAAGRTILAVLDGLGA